jgi:hypothetical protein
VSQDLCVIFLLDVGQVLKFKIAARQNLRDQTDDECFFYVHVHRVAWPERTAVDNERPAHFAPVSRETFYLTGICNERKLVYGQKMASGNEEIEQSEGGGRRSVDEFEQKEGKTHEQSEMYSHHHCVFARSHHLRFPSVETTLRLPNKQYNTKNTAA